LAGRSQADGYNGIWQFKSIKKYPGIKKYSFSAIHLMEIGSVLIIIMVLF
jgi:hypothetical protein